MSVKPLFNSQSSLHFETEDLFAYFGSLPADQRPTFDMLKKTAQELHSRYSSTRAYQDALRGRHEHQKWTKGTVWTPLPSTSSKTPSQTQSLPQPPPPFVGDRILAQSILFMRDTILSKGAAEAVARGDVGTLYETLKVSAGLYHVQLVIVYSLCEFTI